MNDRRVAIALRWWLSRVTRFPLATVACLVALAALALQLTAAHLGFNTDSTELLDADLPFRQALSRYTEQFPQYQNTLIAVVEAPVPELARATAGRLADALRRQQDRFPLVYQPRGGEFLQRHALLYTDSDQLAILGDRLAQAQPLLARLMQEPSIGGYFRMLRTVAEQPGEPQALGPLIEATAGAIAARGRDAPPVSWERLIRGEHGNAGQPARALVITAPRLDYDRVMAGRAAIEQLNETIDTLSVDHPDIRARVTGRVALQHEDLHSALLGAQYAGLAALALVTLVLYTALRSWSLLGVALAALGVGMALSAGAATLAVGHVNLVSIAFAVLYVGLGINYAVHYLIRYREALSHGHAREAAIHLAGVRLGGPLTLCTVTTAIGFFAFVPTAFEGVAELGIIAGLSMFITLLVTYTLLPALLTLIPAPRSGGFHAGLPPAAVVLDWPGRHPRPVRVMALVVGLAAALLATQASFDDNPLNLRDPSAESVTTAMELVSNGNVRSNLVVLADNRQQLRTLAGRLEALDTVRTTIDISDLVPDDQQEKLQQIRDLELVLGPRITSGSLEPEPSPDPAATMEAASRLSAALSDRAAADPAWRRLQRALDDWIQRTGSLDNPSAAIETLQERLLGTLSLALAPLQSALRGAGTFTEADLPETLRDRYRSPEGQLLLQVLPAGDLGEPGATRRFVESVREIAPQATGGPVIQLEAGRAVVTAFRTALASAVAGIALVLLLLLRSISMAVRVLVPLLLGGILTVAAMVLLGLPFNFANVIALPLLLGVGVDNGIHMVSRQHDRDNPVTNALQSSTARAILFGSLATVVSFGNLALSPHRGTATMGVILALGMILILATTFIVLPALFRPASRDA